jgi:hypothetical protein
LPFSQKLVLWQKEVFIEDFQTGTDSDANATCRYVFKNLMRDWSQDGAPERTQSYGRICQEAQKQLAGRNPDDPAKILVPGMTHRLSSSLASLHTAA